MPYIPDNARAELAAQRTCLADLAIMVLDFQGQINSVAILSFLIFVILLGVITEESEVPFYF